MDTPPSEEEIQKQSFEGKPASSEQVEGGEEGIEKADEDSSESMTPPKEDEEDANAEES